jgi:hypothetical protein
MRMRMKSWAAAAALCGSVACGGSPSAPLVPATPPPVAVVPSPTPAPTAAPTPQPTPDPTLEINDNDAPVERVGAGVYYVECGSDHWENSRNATEVPVGCRVQLDATAKDADGVPTNPRSTPEWWYSNPGAIEVGGSNPMGPKITGTTRHTQRINVWVDGVQSNTFSITFY